MGIGGIMFLLGLAMDPSSFSGFFVAGIGLFVGVLGLMVWAHVNYFLE